jgi:uncharacterized membrane protein YccC
MFSISTRAKEAIKTGLALVIVYAIALEMGWDKPYWAAFAVAMISLDTAGASLNKAALRMGGTVVGAAVALTLIALFPQHRWLMLVHLSLYYGFCVYMLTGSKRPYFWFVSAFVCLIIMVDAAPPDWLRSFQTAVTRVQETGMGILVYSLVSVLLWPQSSGRELGKVAGRLVGTQSRLYQAYQGQISATGMQEDAQALRMQLAQLLNHFRATLNGAEADTYGVWELRRQWGTFQQLTTNLGETLERWRESFPEIQPLDLTKLLPNLEAFGAELDGRFAQIERMLSGEAPTTTPKPITLVVDHAEPGAPAHFQKAALALTKAQLDRLETLSRSLFACVQDIRGYARETSKSSVEETGRRGLALDPDRFAAAARVMAALWIASLVWIYLNPPGHTTFVFLSTTWALAAVLVRVNPSKLLPGLVLGIVLAGVAYVFVMPHLSGYAELGLMLFVVTFGTFYLLSEPRHRMTRSLSMAMFNLLIVVQNEQTYDFAHYANTSAAILLALAVAVAVFYVPRSPRPEKVFPRLLRRFFRHAEFLMSRLALDRDDRKGLATRWRMALYRNDLMEMPEKLAALGQRIDYRMLPDSTPEQVQALTTSLQALAWRIKELVDAREAPQADLLVEALIEDVRAWRMLVQQQFRLWADDPVLAIEPGVDIRDRLTTRIARLEASIGETLHVAGEGKLSEGDYENFYRYLGAFRGLSESGIEYSRQAQEIDWARWREARF